MNCTEVTWKGFWQEEARKKMKNNYSKKKNKN